MVPTVQQQPGAIRVTSTLGVHPLFVSVGHTLGVPQHLRFVVAGSNGHDLTARRGSPAEPRQVRRTSPYQGGVDVEATEDGRQVGRMAEHVRAIPHGVATPQPPHPPPPDQQVADQRFPTDQGHVGQHVPWSHVQPAGGDQTPQPVFVIGVDRKVVGHRDGLGVQQEVLHGTVVQLVTHGVYQLGQHRPERFEWPVPLPVPVHVGDDMDPWHGSMAHGSPGRTVRRSDVAG